MNDFDFSIKDQVALVTGGRRGIGKTIAMAFANAGANVAVCDVVTEDGALEETANEIRRLGRRSMALKVDTSRPSDVESVVKQVAADFGTIDILVNNAAIDIPGPFLEITDEAWDKVMSINLKGYFLMARTASRIMVQHKKGNIISMASQYAFRTDPNMGLYSIAKAGVAMLTRVMARELGGYGIRANAIAPGLVKTEFNEVRWGSEAFMSKYIPTVPLGRIGDVSDVVGAALFLASPASSYVNGHLLIVDGGRNA